MKDRIDERDEKERIARSIIKFWNVNYIVSQPATAAPNQSVPEQPVAVEETSETPVGEPQTEEPKIDMDDEATRKAMEIFARLESEAADDEAAKQAEIDAAKAAASGGEPDSSLFNASTGSYSGTYGQNNTLDEAGMDQVNAILGNQKKAMTGEY